MATPDCSITSLSRASFDLNGELGKDVSRLLVELVSQLWMSSVFQVAPCFAGSYPYLLRALVSRARSPISSEFESRGLLCQSGAVVSKGAAKVA